MLKCYVHWKNDQYCHLKYKTDICDLGRGLNSLWSASLQKRETWLTISREQSKVLRFSEMESHDDFPQTFFSIWTMPPPPPQMINGRPLMNTPLGNENDGVLHQWSPASWWGRKLPQQIWPSPLWPWPWWPWPLTYDISVENSYRPVARGYLFLGLGDLLQEAGSPGGWPKKSISQLL